MNLSGLTPITEQNKTEWTKWIKDTLDFLDTVSPDNPPNNRIFGTAKDDMDEVYDVLGSVYLTLQDYNIVKK